MMVLDTYGKKSDLPLSEGSFKPRHNNRNKSYLRIIGALVALIVLWRVFFGGSSAAVEDDLDSLLDRPLVENNNLNDYEKYSVTKEGVTKEANEPEIAVDSEKSLDDLYHSSVGYYDLNDYTGSKDGQAEGDIVLFLMPLRNAEHVLAMAFRNLMNLTYDHSLIDIAFLISDCSEDDRTLETVFEYSVALQNGTLATLLEVEEKELSKNDIKGTKDLYLNYMDPAYVANVQSSYQPPYHSEYLKPFRSIQIFKKDFGQKIGQGFSDRHGVKIQGIRRKLMGRARNWLTSNALQAHHSWVYWRDADIETCPGSVIQDLMKHDYDVMVPNVWRPLPVYLGNAQAYDLNSWIESDPALELAKTLNEDDVIVEGYAEYPTWRVHLAYIREDNGNPDDIIDLDGVGGVSILAKAKIFRQGVHFPAFTFLNHAETEAFGKLAKKMGFRVGGLPHYTIWHIYEPSEDDLIEIAKKERKKRRGGNN